MDAIIEKHLNNHIGSDGNDKKNFLDILVLPEMAFTGYELNLDKAIQIAEKLDDKGPTFQWCKEKAELFGCLVMCGYPEKVSDEELYNSAMVFDRDGKLVKNIRKTFLYEVDEAWAQEGPGFQSWYCPWLDVKISFGICMDINQYQFDRNGPSPDREFANKALKEQSQLILFSCAWKDMNPLAPDNNDTPHYWLNRLLPLHEYHKAKNSRCYFACANRNGKDIETTFTGNSCVISLHSSDIEARADKTSQTMVVANIDDFLTKDQMLEGRTKKRKRLV